MRLPKTLSPKLRKPFQLVAFQAYAQAEEAKSHRVVYKVLGLGFWSLEFRASGGLGFRALSPFINPAARVVGLWVCRVAGVLGCEVTEFRASGWGVMEPTLNPKP